MRIWTSARPIDATHPDSCVFGPLPGSPMELAQAPSAGDAIVLFEQGAEAMKDRSVAWR